MLLYKGKFKYLLLIFMLYMENFAANVYFMLSTLHIFSLLEKS